MARIRQTPLNGDKIPPGGVRWVHASSSSEFKREAVRPLCALSKLAAASLPLCRITTGVQHGEHDNDIPFNGKVGGVWKAPEECAADTRPKSPVLQWTLDDAIIRRMQLVEKTQSQPRLFVLVSMESRLNVKIDPWVGDKMVLDHRLFLPRRWRISSAGRAVVGLRR